MSGIEINLPNGYKLVAVQNMDQSYPYEIFVGLEDPGGCWIQDIAIIRNAYEYSDASYGPKWKDDEMTVCVYADCEDECYTDEFNIGIWKGDQ